jgi:hypothetical protein
MLFDPGHVVATPAALNHLALSGSSPLELIRRHIGGDWGRVCASDGKLNDQALADDSRILSAYEIAGTRLYVITEWDRSYTTILLASEY